MKMMFIAPSQFSVGELHNAIYLARQLESAGVQTHFLTSQNLLVYAQSAGMSAAPLKKTTLQTTTVQAQIDAFQPDAILLADYHNLDLESPLIDLDYLLQTGIPCATVDSLSWGPDARVLKNRLFEGTTSKRSNNKAVVNLRAVPEQMKIIRTCPVTTPVDEGRIKSFTLYTKPFHVEPDVRAEVRRRFGCEQDSDKLVMVSKAAWANLLVKMRLMETKLYMDASYNYEYFVQELISMYLGVQELPSKVVIVGIANEKGFLERAADSKIQFVSLPFLQLNEYEDLMFSCDLFITDNITSCSMAKAMFGYVPVISLLNTKLSNVEHGGMPEFPAEWKISEPFLELMEKWTRGLNKGLYPFYTYPNGWVEELQPLLEGNPFYNIVTTCEMFDVETTGKTLHKLLYCEETKQQIREKQAAYIDQVINLPKSIDMLNFILEDRSAASNNSK